MTIYIHNILKRLNTLILFGFILFPVDMHSQTEEQLEEWQELGFEAFQKQNYKEAIYYFERILSELDDQIEYGELNSVINSFIADCYANLGNYAKAVELGSQALELGEKHPIYAKSLNNLAFFYSKLGDYAKAIELGSQALKIRKETLGENHPDYATSLNNLTTYYSELGDYAKAVELINHALEIEKETLGENHPNYAKLLSNLSLYYCHLGNYAIAIELETKALKIIKEVLGENHPDYANSLNNLAGYYSELGDYAKAVEFSNQTLEITKETLGENHPDYATSLNNLANDYFYLGDYAKAMELINHVLEIAKETLGENHPNYATILNNLAVYYSELGDYAKAVELINHALEIRKETLGENHPDYATSLSNLASDYYHLGDYAKAVELENKALEIRKETLGENHPDYAGSLSNLATYYSEFGDYAKAIELETKALEIRKETLGENHPDYALSLNNLACYYTELRDNAKAVELYNQALEISKETLGENHSNYALSLGNLAGCYSYLGDYAKAVIYWQKNAEILHSKILHQFGCLTGSQRATYWSKFFYAFTDIYPFWIFNYSSRLHQSVDEPNFPIKTIVGFALILSCLFVLTLMLHNRYSGQKIVIWKFILVFSCIVLGCLLIVLGNRTRGNIDGSTQDVTHMPIADLYDKSALFAKGLLLTTEIEMNKLIQESGDEEALSLFEELRQKRLMLQKLYEKPIAERFINTDSLEQEADKLEGELVKRSQVYGDFSRKLRTTWKDVQTALDKDEMAVEFLSFGVGTDSTMVVALTLRKDDKEPKMIPLFEQKQMEKVKDIKTSRVRDVRKTKTFYSQEVTDLVWKPMSEELKGIKRIYFSAAGILHKVGIEYAPGMEDYEMYRLSTTREVIDMKEKGEKNLNAQSDAVLYGGVDYEALAKKSKAPNEETRKNQKDEENTHRSISIDLHHAFIDSLKVRGTTLDSLPGTLDEVKNISSCFEQKHRKTITGTDATETSVKSLPDKLPKILHIATHGFYYTESEKKRMDARKDLRLLDDLGNSGRKEDEALNRSGLFMAGANRALKGEELPMEADDGILTAQEIAKIDLRGVDMVVLSACETGQGDINQGEGVYGLQRGFKKAGVQTILMSLWKVSDKATEMLMTEFYKQVCAGQNKRAALQMAQKKVREYKNQEGKQQFEDPFFWAGFILLD